MESTARIRAANRPYLITYDRLAGEYIITGPGIRSANFTYEDDARAVAAMLRDAFCAGKMCGRKSFVDKR